MLHGKGELRLQTELRLLISRPWDGKIILDYLGGPNVVTRVLITERGRQGSKSQRVCDDRSRGMV